MIPLSELGQAAARNGAPVGRRRGPAAAASYVERIGVGRTSASQKSGRRQRPESGTQADVPSAAKRSGVSSAAQQLSNPKHFHVLCRSMEQLEAALDCGASSVIADFRESAPLRRSRSGGASWAARRSCWPRRESTSRASRTSFESLGQLHEPDGFSCETWRAWPSAAARACRRWPISRSMP